MMRNTEILALRPSDTAAHDRIVRKHDKECALTDDDAEKLFAEGLRLADSPEFTMYGGRANRRAFACGFVAAHDPASPRALGGKTSSRPAATIATIHAAEIYRQWNQSGATVAAKPAAGDQEAAGATQAKDRIPVTVDQIDRRAVYEAFNHPAASSGVKPAAGDPKAIIAGLAVAAGGGAA